MTFDELIVLLPCRSLDDFPTNLKGDEAEGLLAGWSALWHPALIAAAGKMPTWRTAEFAADVLTGKLIVVPPVVEKTFAGDFEIRAQNEGARVIRGLQRRPEIVAALLAALASTETPTSDSSAALRHAARTDLRPLTSDLVADFLALGTVVLYSELLVRRMRYSSTLTEGPFQEHLLAAANAAVAGNDDEARRNLTLCCNTLVEARGRYYPVDMSLIDLTLVAATTIGPALRQELSGSQPLNLLISADVLVQMAEREPASLAAVRQAIETGTAAVIGGEWGEAELPLLPLEAILAQFQTGLAEYQKLLGSRPTVFGRRRYGLTPVLPQILNGLGFRGAVHCTLDDGRFPQPDGSKARWEGLDNATIDTLGRVPLDASQHGTFTALAEKIGHAMDHDHVATIGFAHWPGQTSPYYDDLRRIMAIAPVIGKFATLEQFFANTDSSGTYARFTADEYRMPYLQQDVAAGRADPLSQWARYARQFAAAESCQALETLTAVLRGRAVSDQQQRIPLTPGPSPQKGEGSTDAGASERLSAAIEQFATALPRAKSEPSRSYLAVNAASYGRRVLIDVSELAALPAVKAPIKAAEEAAGTKHVVVDLPPLGFVWIGPSADGPGQSWTGEPLATGQTLRNEFCEVAIHPTTGGIQSLHDFRARGNRLSQQLVFRAPDGPAASADPEFVGSRMVADSVEVTSPARLFGEITSRGQLLDAAGKRLAGFVQRVQLSLGSRVVGLEIELDPVEPLAADPWSAYFACRYAWADRAAELRRGVHLESHLTRAKRIESPQFIELDAAAGRTVLLCGGSPYHQRIGQRMLDTLLAVRGEQAKVVRLGIGVDVPHAWMAALDLLAPPTVRSEVAPPPTPVSYGWLFSLDAKNVVVTHWEPILADDGDTAGRVVGVRFRVLETEGRGGRCQLRCIRAPVSAQRTDFENKPAGDLTLDGDRVAIDLGSYEWIQAEARW